MGHPANNEHASGLAARYRELLETQRSALGRLPSDQEVADESGLSRQEVFRIRTGKAVRPQARTLEKLATYFQVQPPTDFYGGRPIGHDNRLQLLLRTYDDLSDHGQQLLAAFAAHTLMLEEQTRQPSGRPDTPLSPPAQTAVAPTDQHPPGELEHGDPTSR